MGGSLLTRSRRIVQQLSQDNAALNSQVKIIEAERNLLVSETGQLREVPFSVFKYLNFDFIFIQELKVLEDRVEATLLNEDSREPLNSTELEVKTVYIPLCMYLKSSLGGKRGFKT